MRALGCFSVLVFVPLSVLWLTLVIILILRPAGRETLSIPEGLLLGTSFLLICAWIGLFVMKMQLGI